MALTAIGSMERRTQRTRQQAVHRGRLKPAHRTASKKHKAHQPRRHHTAHQANEATCHQCALLRQTRKIDGLQESEFGTAQIAGKAKTSGHHQNRRKNQDKGHHTNGRGRLDDTAVHMDRQGGRHPAMGIDIERGPQIERPETMGLRAWYAHTLASGSPLAEGIKRAPNFRRPSFSHHWHLPGMVLGIWQFTPPLPLHAATAPASASACVAPLAAPQTIVVPPPVARAPQLP